MQGKTIHDLQVGQSAAWTKMITDEDVTLFASVSGDNNPVHMSEEFAMNTMFQKRIAHGMLCGSLFSTVLGTQLPGEGSIYLSQSLQFKKPVYLNDTITATVTVIEVIEDRNRVVMDTTAINQRGEIVISGQAVLMPAHN